MSIENIRKQQAKLHKLVAGEASKLAAALAELGCLVTIATADGTVIVDTLGKGAATAASAQHKQRARTKLRRAAHGKRDIAGPTRYREILAALPAKETAEILVPDGFDVGDILGPVYGGAHRRFGAGNYTLEHDDRTVLVTRHA